MKLLLSTLAAIAVAASPPSAEAAGAPAGGEWLAEAFKSLCFEPFEAESKVAEAVAAYSGLKFNKVEPKPGGPGLGTAWEAPKASLYYSNADWLPRDLPSPQCHLQVEAGPGFDHAATAAALQHSLAAGVGKTSGKKGRYRTEWNFAGPNGTKRRLFFSSEPAGNGTAAKISLLNLR